MICEQPHMLLLLVLAALAAGVSVGVVVDSIVTRLRGEKSLNAKGAEQ